MRYVAFLTLANCKCNPFLTSYLFMKPYGLVVSLRSWRKNIQDRLTKCDSMAEKKAQLYKVEKNLDLKRLGRL